MLGAMEPWNIFIPKMWSVRSLYDNTDVIYMDPDIMVLYLHKTLFCCMGEILLCI